MQSQLSDTVAEKKNNLLYQMLSDLIIEKEGAKLLNKNLLMQLLILKIYQPSKFKEIKGGYSNNTYYYAEENLVLRFPKAYNPLFPELSIEVQNLIQAKLLNLTPLKTIAYYSKYSLLVTEFIPSYQSFSAADFKNPCKLISLAHLVKKLHYSQVKFKKNSETAISFIDESSQCFQNIQPILNKKDYQILKKLLGIRSFLTRLKCLKVPSHGDLHHFNVIEMNGRLQLIDWELSSMEDPAYDISRLFCVTGLNTKQKEIFLETYKNSYNIILSELDVKNLIKRIFLHESLNYFSIVIWARYAMPFFYKDKQILLKETIKNYKEKETLIRY
ncbi:phosphotransferase [Rickettsiella endosymbiont of Litargus connexus]|jgi:thiamine kinase-like enzyme|uniref:phosphotransferase n=1 Tax=Rickettsiella endosymbiont of Litargus connexus TaxID=3066237 RepID=UPI00376EA776